MRTLPQDDFSSDNAIAIDQGRRWPLAIDPQVALDGVALDASPRTASCYAVVQLLSAVSDCRSHTAPLTLLWCVPSNAMQGLANKWIRALEKQAGLLVVKQSDPGFLRALENAIQFGEEPASDLDSALLPLALSHARVVAMPSHGQHNSLPV